ncbi:MAG: ABC transporter permease [Actinobacteria bacterium]|nr:ABC transporter permease [Actinomycetota bacterium]
MRSLLVSVASEVRKGLLFTWSERLQVLAETPVFALFILLLGPLLGTGGQAAAGRLSWTLQSSRTSLLVLAFLPSTVFYFLAVKLFWRLLGEIQSGTLEQVWLSPLPFWLTTAVGRVVAALAETLAVTGAVYGIVSLFVPLRYHWAASALLPASMLILAAVGYSLIIGGMTLAWKHVQPLQEAFLLLAQIFAFAALPVLAVPRWFAGIGRAFPVTSAVASLYGVLIRHRPVTGLWGTGGLIFLLVTPAAYLAAGVIAFRLGERAARSRGTLARS